MLPISNRAVGGYQLRGGGGGAGIGFGVTEDYHCHFTLSSAWKITHGTLTRTGRALEDLRLLLRRKLMLNPVDQVPFWNWSLNNNSIFKHK